MKIKTHLIIVFSIVGLLAAATAVFSAGVAPPAGNTLPVQATKNANYTIKSSDLRSMIPFDCPSGCTVTFPALTNASPKGYPILIQNAGAAGTVTVVTVLPSTIKGMPTVSGAISLASQGNYVTLNADTTNNYLAFGSTGAGGAVVTNLVLRNGGGHIARNGGGSVARN